MKTNHVINEKDRKDAAVSYCQHVINDLRRELKEYEYEELPSGELSYIPNQYEAEKLGLRVELRKWEKMLEIMTDKLPFVVYDW